jgi:hypothetical protein
VSDTPAARELALKKTERSPDFSALSILTSYFISVAEAQMLRVAEPPGSDFPGELIFGIRVAGSRGMRG